MRNGHLKNAKGFLERAHRGFQVARKAGDELGIRQAAEKGWGAAREATRGLLLKKNVATGGGTRRIEQRLIELEKRDKLVRERHLRPFFTTFLYDLHAECFGDGDIRLAKIERDLTLLKRYIDEIERL